MRPEQRDLAYLWDMREEARQIAAFLKDIPYAKFCDKQYGAVCCRTLVALSLEMDKPAQVMR